MSGIGSWRGTVGTGTDVLRHCPRPHLAPRFVQTYVCLWVDEYLLEKVYSMFMIMYEYKPYEYKPRW
jgi:hypothetical protein